MALPAHLLQVRAQVEAQARAFGLDFFDVLFEMVTFEQMNMLAAYGGFPTRYPHWRFGMSYGQLAKGYTYGLSKIYELVINHDPCYAYLMDANADVDQKLVMAHVYGHCDFFKNNFAFAQTNRKMIDVMANHATRVRRHIDRLGLETVERTIDRGLSLENLIDRHAPYIKRPGSKLPVAGEGGEAAEDGPPPPLGLRADREYMQDYINPSEYLAAQRQKQQEKEEARKHFPASPQRDVLLFLLEHAPLHAWEQDILGIIREEAYYFAPQGMTKIINEGWASYWHTTLLTQKVLLPSELIDYADVHAGTMATARNQINPYKLGLELFRSIESRWDRGCFGPEWEACDDLGVKKTWDKQVGLGRAKIFEVRRHYTDVTFIDAFLTEEFAREQQLFTFGRDARSEDYKIQSRAFAQVKSQLLRQLTNLGEPIIQVIDGNYKNRSELLLEHIHDGCDLNQKTLEDTLAALLFFWKRPVAINTLSFGKAVQYRYDGHTLERTPLG